MPLLCERGTKVPRSYYTEAMFTPETNKRFGRMRLAPILLAVLVLFIGAISAFYVFSQVDRAGREHILERVATIAVAVPQEQLQELSGTEDDLGTPAYETLKLFLTKMRSVNGDARFLYVIGKNGEGDLFFYADSEPAESADYSPPGQIYYEATPAMQALFEDGKRRTEGPDQDRWGLWISGYAPVVDEAGTVVAMLGMDLPANSYLGDAMAYASLPLLVSLLLTLGIIATERTRRRETAYLEQKAEFLSIASHEIRTPLTGIRWAIEGLLKRQNPPLNPKTRTVLALVHESCLGLIGRVNNLLDLTALEGGNTARLRPEAIDLRDFVEDIADSLALSAQERHVSIEVDGSFSEAGTLTGDRQMLHHALFNLLTNAVKYTREGSAVRIQYARVSGMHQLSIIDQGKGIAPEDQQKIFAGYHRTKEAIRSGAYGTGLGLYLVKKAAELHGGTVAVSSVLEEGSTFTLSLPADA